MNKGLTSIILAIILILFLIPNILALETIITVKTGVYYNVTVNVLNPSNGDALETLTGNSGSSGEAVMTSNVTQSLVDVSVVARENGKIIKLKTFKDYNTGSQIVLDMRVDNTPVVDTINATTPAVNTTLDTTIPAVNTTPTVDTTIPTTDTQILENITEATPTTGQSVSNSSQNSKLKIPSYIIYIVAGILIAGILVFFIMRFAPFKKSHENIKITSASEFLSSKSEQVSLEEAERKLQETQAEINRLKQIKEAESRFEQARKDLENLKK